MGAGWVKLFPNAKLKYQITRGEHVNTANTYRFPSSWGNGNSTNRNPYTLWNQNETHATCCTHSSLVLKYCTLGRPLSPLKKRMYGYQNPSPTQNTNVKGNAFLKEILDSGNTIEIYALPDHGLLHFGDFHINLAAGLEDSLISKLKPKWNGCGLKS
jgi:hypothetical protein